MNLLRWILFPLVLRLGGDSGGGGGSNAEADEARKDVLRRRIDSLYGVAPSGARPSAHDSSGSGFRFGPSADAVQQQGAAFDADAAQATDAAKQMDAERAGVSDSTRSYYSDQLARSFGSAERNNRFNLARQGLLGGSANVDSNAELETDRTLGATRIDEAARRAAASLDTQREQERMNAIGLVNSGAGESAVSSAQAGLRNSLNQVSNTQKTNLFGDLFSTGADAFASSNANAANAAMLARFQQQLGAFFPTRSSGGTVTPSG